MRVKKSGNFEGRALARERVAINLGAKVGWRRPAHRYCYSASVPSAAGTGVLKFKASHPQIESLLCARTVLAHLIEAIKNGRIAHDRPMGLSRKRDQSSLSSLHHTTI